MGRAIRVRALREALVLLVVAAAPAALAIALHPQLANRLRAGLEEGAVRLEEIRDAHADVLWIDARSEADFARDHIPGALRLDEETFERDLGAVLASWTPGRHVVVYCSTTACGTSKAVAQRLRAAGLSDVFFLHGGWEAWTTAARE